MDIQYSNIIQNIYRLYEKEIYSCEDLHKITIQHLTFEIRYVFFVHVYIVFFMT